MGRNYLQQATYKPDGSFSGATVGLDSLNHWTETRDYNSRLQARKVQVQKSGQTLLGLNWVYSAQTQTLSLRISEVLRKRIRQTNPTLDRRGGCGYRFRAAQAAGVNSAIR